MKRYEVRRNVEARRFVDANTEDHAREIIQAEKGIQFWQEVMPDPDAINKTKFVEVDPLLKPFTRPLKVLATIERPLNEYAIERYRIMRDAEARIVFQETPSYFRGPFPRYVPGDRNFTELNHLHPVIVRPFGMSLTVATTMGPGTVSFRLEECLKVIDTLELPFTLAPEVEELWKQLYALVTHAQREKHDDASKAVTADAAE